MKFKLSICLLFICFGNLRAQQWSDFSNQSIGLYPASTEIYNGEIYFFYVSDGSNLVVEKLVGYQQYSEVANITISSGITKLQTFKRGSEILIAAGSAPTSLQIYQFLPTTNALGSYGSPLTTLGMSDDWEGILDAQNNLKFVFTSNYLYDYTIANFNVIGASWTAQNVTTELGFQSSPPYSGEIKLYSTSDTLFIAINDVGRLFKCPLSYLNQIIPYSPLSSSRIEENSSYENGKIHFIGDNIAVPKILFTNSTNVSYLLDYSAQIDYNTASTPIEVLKYSTLRSKFSPVLGKSLHFGLTNDSGNAGDISLEAFLIDPTVATPILSPLLNNLEINIPQFYDVNFNSCSIDDNNKHHLVQYKGVEISTNFQRFKATNTLPSFGTQVPNTSLCLGNENEIFSEFEVIDPDGDPTFITSVTPTTGAYQNCYAVFQNSFTDASGSHTKFKIYGEAIASGSSTFVITYTDMFEVSTDASILVTVSPSLPNVVFSENPINLCSNENLVDLSNFIVNYIPGTFTLNGVLVQGTTINPLDYDNGPSYEILSYKGFIDGCLITANAPYIVQTVGTASVNVIETNCGSAGGSATVSFSPGTSALESVEWTTGETTATINNLVGGTYYYNVKDQAGCNVRGEAVINVLGTGINLNFQDESCSGLNDGEASVSVSGISDFTVLWSNGETGTSISNLAPGEYWMTVLDNNSSCDITRSLLINPAAKIEASFTTFEPDCGVSNGNIYGVFTGGFGTLSPFWQGFGVTNFDLLGVPFGNYTVTITDANGCSKDFSYQLDDYQAIDIRDSVIDASCQIDNGAILVDFLPDINMPVPLLNFTWEDGAFAEDRSHLSPGEYKINVTSGPGWNGNFCNSQKTITVGLKAPLVQQLCVITVDTATTTNLLVWEKEETVNISHYNIYREEGFGGKYMLIDTILATEETVFNDVVASPMAHSWRYMISAKDLCNTEGPLSIPHKTLYLNSIVDIGNGSRNIYWDDYEGTADVSTYKVWRKTSLSPWSEISGPIAIGTSFYNDNYTLQIGETNVDYYVEMILGSTCSSEKAQDFNAQRSNREKGSHLAGQGTGDDSNSIAENESDISIFPNPAKDFLYIENSGNQEIEYTLFELTGRIVSKGKIISTPINLSGLENGIYELQLTIDRVKKLTKIIVQH